MNAEFLDGLARQFAFDQWSRPQDTQEEQPFVWRFMPGGDELPGWRMHRADREAAPSAGVVNTFDATRRAPEAAATHSLWLGAGEGEGSMLRVDTLECASRQDARERLLALLGEHQGAAVFRQDRDAAGEVAFTAPGGYAQLFTRGNLVVEVRNAARKLVQVAAQARELDALLLARPAATEAERMGMRASDLAPGELSALAERVAAVEDAPGQPAVWFKFFARGGEVVLEGGRPVFRPATEGPPVAEPRISAYVVGLPRTRPNPGRTFGLGA